MNGLIFLLLFIICTGLIYIVHRYFGKHEFYLLAVIYSIISFILSFKIINIFGLSINMSIIFSSGLLMTLYYFINRYNYNEVKKYIIVIMISTICFEVILLLGAIMLPSIYDENIVLLKELIFSNFPIMIIYPVGLLITLLLSSYSFKQLKEVKNNKIFKNILALIGIIFIDVFVFIYFSYTIIINFSDSLSIAMDNYFIKIIIIIFMYFLINKLMKIKKVKA